MTPTPTPTPDSLREALDYALARDAGGGYVRSTEPLSVDVLRGLEVQGFTIAPIAVLDAAPALDVERLADAEHRWCVEVEGEFALNHGPDSHRRQATFILARLSGDPA